MSSIIKALNGIDFFYPLESGAVQKVCGNTDSGIWKLGLVKFTVYFTFPDGQTAWKELSPDIAQTVN